MFVLNSTLYIIYQYEVNNFAFYNNQCLGSVSVGSARFWLPGSGSAKKCGTTDPDPRAKYQPKTGSGSIFF